MAWAHLCRTCFEAGQPVALFLFLSLFLLRLLLLRSLLLLLHYYYHDLYDDEPWGIQGIEIASQDRSGAAERWW